MSTPSKRIDPPLGSTSRTIMRASVDLPQPDSPTMPSVSHAASANETPFDRMDVAPDPPEHTAPHREALGQILDLEQRLGLGRRGPVLTIRHAPPP
jgi:hypothetical protein